MVMPLVDEARPRCHSCGRGFDDMDGLREHRRAEHGGGPPGSGPAPGDVSVF